MAQFARGPQSRATSQSLNAPHAALLIDFDNVTMGIRSDLTKELRNLLNSDVIKGKVAVQRAYADWRRYPQYIVPLAENSVDLIFAPAYGSSKKNATDIRLAIDALELVFTRPEIGTFILLSGDSDFSSLVLKLKEYGKYVIGVGIRESSSDLLVQNCDEYYSYSGLTGLTRAGEEPIHAASDDPWELVAIAVRQMHEQKDVMRSDRLKQILLQLDPNFDEKALGFPKFNRFLQEAANRGSLSLRKMENGQFEVAPAESMEPVVTAAAALPATAEPSAGRRERGRGRGRDRDRERAEVPAPAMAAIAAVAEPVLAPVAVTPPVAPEAPVVKEAPAIAAEARAEKPEPVPAQVTDLRGAYELLRRVTSDLTKARGAATRDSDVKRRMLEVSPGFDEGRFGFSKFSRFLRQAHDEGVIDLHRIENGTYEVSPAGRELPSAAVAAPEEARGREREREGREAREGRGMGRGRREREIRVPAAAAPEVVEPAMAAAPAPIVPAEAPKAERAPAAAPAQREERPRAAEPAAKPAAAAPAAAAAAPAAALGFRRGSRRGGAPVAPPPILAGQGVPVARAPEPAGREEVPAREAAPVEARARREAAPQPVAEAPAAAAGSPLDQLQLPTTGDAIIERLVGYNGVGRKSAEAAVSAFGPEVFRVLQEQPERVREELGSRRADPLLKGWQAEVASVDGAKRGRGARKKPATKRGEQMEVFEAPKSKRAAAKTAAAKSTTAGTRRAGKKTTARKATSRTRSARTAKAGGSRE